MAQRIQIRRDTAANWTSANPVLAEGEFGYESDTQQFKMGDGVTVWTSLPYVSFAIDINGRTDIGAPALGDELPIWDISDSQLKKVTVQNLTNQSPDPDTSFVLRDDFITSSTTGNLSWTATNSGTGASTQETTSFIGGSNAMGVIQMDTGTTATGRSALNLSTTALLPLLGNGWNLDLRFRIGPETSLSTVAERYAVTFGFGDNAAAGIDQTDGLYFQYRDDLSANWRCVSSAAGVRTTVDSGSAVVTSLRRFRINFIDGGTPQADFYINDVLVASITTTLPYNASQNFGIFMKIEKSIGTAQRNLSCDYMWLQGTRTTNR